MAKYHKNPANTINYKILTIPWDICRKFGDQHVVQQQHFVIWFYQVQNIAAYITVRAVSAVILKNGK